MIQTILRLTCDECGLITECEVKRSIGDNVFYDMSGNERGTLKRAGAFPGKIKDLCGRCEGARRIEAGKPSYSMAPMAKRRDG